MRRAFGDAIWARALTCSRSRQSRPTSRAASVEAMCLRQKGGLPTTALRIVSIDWSKAANTLVSSPEGSPPDEGGNSTS